MAESAPLPIDISVRALHDMRQAGERLLLIDCREPQEYQTARIEGAMLIPMREIPARLAELAAHQNERIVVHCHHGGRSLRVTHYLRQQGFAQAQNLAGGIDAWSQEIDPNVPRYE